MLILGIHSGYHDACACLFDGYRMVAAVAQERMTRRKIDGGRIPTEAINECLTVAGRQLGEVDAVALGRGAFPWRYYTHFTGGRYVEGKVRQLLGKEKHKSMERELVLGRRSDAEAIFDGELFLRELGLRPGIPVRFFNHHLAHALPTLFHTDWQDALLYTADGGGDNVQYSHRVFRDGALATWYGGDEEFLRPMRIDSLGLAYGYATQALGFRINKHEGKLTGLAAYGQPALAPALAAHFRVADDGAITSDFASNPAMRAFVMEWAKGAPREDVAASVQRVLEDFIIASVDRLLRRAQVRHLGLSGGVFANVRLNQKLAEQLPVDEIFVYPAMSDQGLAAGGVLQFLLERDGLDAWLGQRYPLTTLYHGRDPGAAMDAALAGGGFAQVSAAPAETAADLLAQGKIVGLYTLGMEYGPRALGARTILASPVDADVNRTLNDRLERSEFMPFAPVVRDVDATRIFALDARTLYAARFMTTTCAVRDEWRQRIPAVVHVDGTARPQVIARQWNPLYYDILSAYAARTGVPVLVNTSFNVHEEPIIDTPQQCARALAEGRIDYVATQGGVWGPRAYI
jgi:carbamoyltransferase